MSRTFTTSLTLLLWLALLPLGGLLQAQERDSSTDRDAEDPSRETDISEDNYRRFMELEDRRLERPAFPIAAPQPTAGLKKLGALPESSQKHLRNQLRGIISSRGPWTPAEQDKTYAFTPSAEAREDGQLLRQEAEAWSELVSEYHEREAAILAGTSGQMNSASPQESLPPGQQAEMPPGMQPGSPMDAQATTPSGTPPGSSQQTPGQSGEGLAGTPGSGAQSGPEGQAGPPGNEGAGAQNGEGEGQSASGADASAQSRERPEIPDWSPEPANESSPIVMTEKGAVQNASDYLKARGLASSNPAEIGKDPLFNQPVDVARSEQQSRWGEESQTLLSDREPSAPARQRGTTRSQPPQADRLTRGREATAPGNSLTRRELQDVQGVSLEPSPQEDAFSSFTVLSDDLGDPEAKTVPEPESGSGSESQNNAEDGSENSPENGSENGSENSSGKVPGADPDAVPESKSAEDRPGTAE